MLKFIRNILVSIQRTASDTLIIHGILDDDIYGLELDVTVSIPDLKVLELCGKWNRWTTPECPRAIPLLQEAVGYSIQDNDFAEKVKKRIGRKSCRHFADLLIECGNCANEAFKILRRKDEWEQKGHRKSDVSIVNERETASEPVPLIESSSEKSHNKAKLGSENVKKILPKGMIIDLHAHSFPASPCSSVEVDELIREAKKIGLDGICLTDHNHVWAPGRIQDLRQKHDYLVLGGNEITTDQGDMIVFGLDKDIKTIITIKELKKEVLDSGGFIIAAHPFRGFLTFGVGRLGLNAEVAMKRPVFRYVDAVEVLNGSVTEEENEFAGTIASRLGLKVTGGSDAHELDKVGWYATRFSFGIRNELDMIQALKDGDYSPITFRKEVRGVKK